MQNYHRHTSYSIGDSAAMPEEYAKRAVELGHKVISSVEHGWQGYYHKAFELAKKYDLKFVFGTEAYWVKDRQKEYEDYDKKTGELKLNKDGTPKMVKDRSNNHIIILAKNENGRRSINRILSEANETGYFYKPRIDLDLIFSLPPDDVFVTSACVGFWSYEDSDDIVVQLYNYFKDNFMLEIQYHNTQKQIQLNQHIKKLSEKHNIKMIVGLDSHYIYPEQSVERDDILAGRNIQFDDNEIGWYMDYPDDDTIRKRFKEQGVFDETTVQKAMDNTDILLTFDGYDDVPIFTTDIKLPTLYPDKTQEERNKIYSTLISKLFKDYMKDVPKERYKEYFEGVKQEVSVYKETGMVDYPLIDYEIIKRGVEKGGLITSTGRGCFTKDALIHTNYSLKPICDVQIGEKVIDMNGEFKTVLNRMEYEVEEDLVKINHIYGTIKNHPLICTKDHKILIKRNEIIDWVAAENIKTGDYVCLPKIKSFSRNDESKYIDLNNYNVFGYKYDDQYIYEYVPYMNNEYPYSPSEIARYFKVSKKLIEDFANGIKDDFVRKPGLLKDVMNYIPFKSIEGYRQYVHSMKVRPIHRYIHKDYLMGQFIGLMYGDGFNTAERKCVGLAINSSTQKDSINRSIFEKICLRVGMKMTSKKSTNKDLIQLYCYSKVFENYLSTELFVSQKGKDKEFNPNLFNESHEFKMGILDGLFLSDGCNTSERKSFDNTSLSLINAFKILSLETSNGINGLIIREGGVDNRGYNRKKSYKLRSNLGCFTTLKKLERCYEDEDYWFLPIKNIEILPKQKTKVYDLTVEGSHSYLLNNMIVHNSGVGYFTNTLCGFSKVDRFTSPIKLYPERFISKTRILETKSLPDLDMNLGNPEVFAEAQEEVLGKDHAYPMIAFGTLKKKSAFKLYARANNLDFNIANEISKQIEKYEEALKYADDDEKDDINIYDYVDEQYRNYIEKSEKYWGVISDKKKAPCAYLLYQGSIREEVGLIKCKSESTKKEYITTVIDGAIAEKYKLLKNDLLKVDVVLLTDMIYKRIGIPVHSANEIISLVDNNKKVWDLYANGYTVGVNQCEKESAMKKLRKYQPHNISELCAWIAAIRPAFKSMYSKFESRQSFEYGIPAFDKILQTPQFPYSFILYQEQTMNTLNYAGFPLDECYGIIKAIAKKHPEKVKPLKDRFIIGFKNKIMQDDDIEEEKAEEMSTRVWQIIDDSCGYGFNSAHAYCMAIDSLYCAYLKTHYTYEFYEVLLQVFSDKGKKDKVQALKKEMRTAFGIKEGAYRFRVDNKRFVADKEKGVINPSLLSIKFMNSEIAEKLYEMKDMKLDSFIDFLNASPLDARKLEILIKLSYFEEFGKTQKLLRIADLYDTYHGKKIIKKDKCNLPIELIEKHMASETEKQYRFTPEGMDALLAELCSKIPDQDIPLQTRLAAELEYLGYISYTDPSHPNSAVVMSINTKYTPVLTLYNLSNGQTIKAKLKKKSYENNPLPVGAIINYRTEVKPGWKKVNDEWQQDYSKNDTWITYYTVENYS